MVISLNGKSKRVRQWYRSHIYRMYNFRILFERGKDSTSPQAKHLQKKVEQHINYGLLLKIPEDEIMSFQSDIIKLVKKGKNPKYIIEAILEKDGK